ncbi:hypothetical protein AMELA_G00177230 [Ameiurus melas]|uniref:PAS domain-containing protein n=1 Tax=Ameiurus melas TaxID=219545 RepID=A0A7J6AD26_AMEME|nr:hypothetical protein AMELA_G00177230 [Ameiurus melas]
MTSEGKLLYISENVSHYLGLSMVDLLQRDTFYSMISNNDTEKVKFYLQDKKLNKGLIDNAAPCWSGCVCSTLSGTSLWLCVHQRDSFTTSHTLDMRYTQQHCHRTHTESHDHLHQLHHQVGLVLNPFIEVEYVWDSAPSIWDSTNQDALRKWISDFFKVNVKRYCDDLDLQNLIDSLQRVNHCCGANDPNDWNQNIYSNCSKTNQSRECCGVPFSCCIRDLANWPSVIYVNGKGAALEERLPRNIYIVAGVFIVISLLQMVGIFLARNLISDIETVKFNY